MNAVPSIPALGGHKEGFGSPSGPCPQSLTASALGTAWLLGKGGGLLELLIMVSEAQT